MSSSDVKAFLEQVNSDPALVAKAKAIGTSDYEKILVFAKELGFSFSEQELMDQLSDSIGESSELSENDLDSVAGGTVSVTAATAAAVVGAGVGVGAAATGVTSTTSGKGW